MKFLILSLVLALDCAGCTCRTPDRIEPSYPKHVAGWHYDGAKGYVPIGDLVVKEGEYTENNGLRIRIAELLPPNYCLSSVEFNGEARAKIQFIDVASNRVLCEEAYREFASLNTCDGSLQKIEANGIGAREINLKDRWVHIQIFGYR